MLCAALNDSQNKQMHEWADGWSNGAVWPHGGAPIKSWGLFLRLCHDQSCVLKKETLPRKLSCEWLYQGYSSFWAWYNSKLKRKVFKGAEVESSAKQPILTVLNRNYISDLFPSPHMSVDMHISLFWHTAYHLTVSPQRPPVSQPEETLKLRELKCLFFVHREQWTIAPMSATIQVYNREQCFNFTTCTHSFYSGVWKQTNTAVPCSTNHWRGGADLLRRRASRCLPMRGCLCVRVGLWGIGQCCSPRTCHLASKVPWHATWCGMISRHKPFWESAP